MKVRECLSRARKTRGCSDSQIEAEVLLRHVLGVDRTELYLAMDEDIGLEREICFWRLVQRLCDGEPLSYITGHKEFYGTDLLVSPATLIPRPETELLVDKVIKLARDCHEPVIADIGTGSGAIAISLAIALPQATIIATDISPEALAVARDNCRRQHLEKRIVLLEGDLLSPLAEPVDFIAANLPYVSSTELSHKSHEPRMALDGGKDGLEKISRLIKESHGYFRNSLVMEIGEGQQPRVEEALIKTFPGKEPQFCRDLRGVERIVVLSN